MLGLAITYIKPETLKCNLFSLEISSMPQAQRETRVRQIREDLQRLNINGYGLVWGDAKAGNIIFDKEFNPWLVDFGSGYTDDGVDGNVMSSITDDLQRTREDH